MVTLCFLFGMLDKTEAASGWMKVMLPWAGVGSLEFKKRIFDELQKICCVNKLNFIFSCNTKVHTTALPISGYKM